MNAHSGYDRVADDWYIEPPWAVDALIAAEATVRPLRGRVLDPCCGAGNVPTRLAGIEDIIPIGTDLRPRRPDIAMMDFRDSLRQFRPDCVVSNPPYNQAQEFIEVALLHTWDRVCVVLRLGFLAGQKRRIWWPLTCFARLWVSSVRMTMPPGNRATAGKSGTVDYAWFVFERGYRGPPIIGWLPDVGRPVRQRRRHDPDCETICVPSAEEMP
ncbi:hypothetical protein [Novacetimonas hansenii]|uniref:hypothetical protein n=1 Tax=Novacetimonas hansenii TaxID=436 RepID=UPI0039E99E10